MRFSFYDKLVLIILTVSLLAGGIILHRRHTRPFREITIIKNGIKEEFTLKQVEELLKENRTININTASAKDLTKIPGIGKVLASRIIEHRDQYGNFHRERDLLNVPGVGEKKLEKIKNWVKLEG